jgi:hypothetical protein
VFVDENCSRGKHTKQSRAKASKLAGATMSREAALSMLSSVDAQFQGDARQQDVVGGVVASMYFDSAVYECMLGSPAAAPFWQWPMRHRHHEAASIDIGCVPLNNSCTLISSTVW